MAKDRKHNQQGDDNGMENGTSHDTVYRLSTGRWANVKSKIQSLNLDTVEKGKFADIVAVSGDPLQDISEMQRVKFVMKGGAVIKNDMAMAPSTMTSSN